jgi:hypothetical protein
MVELRGLYLEENYCATKEALHHQPASANSGARLLNPAAIHEFPLLANGDEHLCRCFGDAVERAPIAFLPRLPGDEEDEAVEATSEEVRHLGPDQMPPVYQGGVASRAQVMEASKQK